MRISDWSSDVCSSDLHDGVDLTGADVEVEPVEDALAVDDGLEVGEVEHLAHRPFEAQAHERVGLEDRKRAVEGTRVSVSVELGGRRIIKKTSITTQSGSSNVYRLIIFHYLTHI